MRDFSPCFRPIRSLQLSSDLAGSPCAGWIAQTATHLNARFKCASPFHDQSQVQLILRPNAPFAYLITSNQEVGFDFLCFKPEKRAVICVLHVLQTWLLSVQQCPLHDGFHISLFTSGSAFRVSPFMQRGRSDGH